MEKTNEHLEVLYSQIDSEACAIAKKVTGYDPDTDEELGQYKPKQVAYENIVKWYKAGATSYGERLSDAEVLIEKMVKVLEKVRAYTTDRETYHVYDSFFKKDLDEALDKHKTYKQSTDDTANGYILCG